MYLLQQLILSPKNGQWYSFGTEKLLLASMNTAEKPKAT